MDRRFSNVFYILLLLLSSTCKVPYAPAPITAVNNFLVVEGLINISDSTYISLSRTVNVMSASTVKPELKATITIESDQNGSYPLKEVGNGVYAAPNYNLNPANQYRLRIKTTSGSTYASDFIPAKVTPPIDSLFTDMQPDGIHFSVNAHDATNNTRYYRWDYTETWQFTSFYNSHFTAQNAAKTPPGIVVLPRTNDIYHCWGNFNSATILLNTTAGLSQDILQNSPVNFVQSSSEKLSIRYSFMIRQYAMTKDAYDFWTLLKKNTEQLGSIFDSQPSASIGNIHNINNAAEPVIGFISASTVFKKRIYINYTDMPKSYVADYLNNTPYNKNTCAPLIPNPSVVMRNNHGTITDFPELNDFIFGYPAAPFIPIDVIIPFNPADSSGSHSGAIPICVDCTFRGTNVKPAFWQP